MCCFRCRSSTSIQPCDDVFHLFREGANLGFQGQDPDGEFAWRSTATRRTVTCRCGSWSSCPSAFPDKGLQGADYGLHVTNTLFQCLDALGVTCFCRLLLRVRWIETVRNRRGQCENGCSGCDRKGYGAPNHVLDRSRLTWMADRTAQWTKLVAQCG